MADTEKETVLLMDETSRARKVAEEYAELQKPGNRPGEAKRPGGVFIGTDGLEHDAHGNLLGEGRPEAMVAADKLSGDDVEERLRAIDAEKAALIARRDAARFEEAQKAEKSAADAKAQKTASVPAKRR